MTSSLLKSTQTGQIANSYAAYLDTRINETHERLAGAIIDLRRTAQSNWQLRNAQFQVSECWDTDVGATEKKAVTVHEVQTTPIIEPLPDDPNEWINRNEEDFEAVWNNGKALRQAIQGWKPKSDRELQYLKDETSSIWEIAGNFDATELVMFGFQGV